MIVFLFYCFTSSNDAFYFWAQKPTAKPVPSKTIPAKNGALTTPAKKGKPASSSSESSDGDSSSDSEEEVSHTTINC